MNEKSGHHDTLVYRLAQMLVKLNQGEKLDPPALAEEFGVNLRTIQRDLNERFAYLPLEKIDGRYRLDPAFLGKLSTKDIERFASLAGVRGLFPSLSDEFLRDIFDARIQSALLVKGHHYEDLAGKEALFRQLEQAIVARRHVAFEYRKEEGPEDVRVGGAVQARQSQGHLVPRRARRGEAEDVFVREDRAGAVARDEVCGGSDGREDAAR